LSVFGFNRKIDNNVPQGVLRNCKNGDLMKHTTSQIIDFLRSKKDFFASEFKVKKIGIFGSYARGTGDDESDIDIVVELEKPDLYCLIGVKQTVEEGMGGKVDVVRLRAKMNATLKQRIERDAIYV
jgi:predicted nucleotidyltransferase